jgi:Flp pilus assembly protein CpaB
MDAEYVSERRRRRLVVIFGVLLAVVAAAATYYLVTRPSAAPEPIATKTIVVASQAIAARTQIEADKVTTETVPDSHALDFALTDPSLVIGNVTVVDIAAGQPISADMLSAGTAAGLAILQPGETISPDSPIWRAVSVTVPQDRAVGGMLQPGDHVDLFVTLSPQIYDPNGPANGFTDPGHPPASTDVQYSDQTTKVTWTNLELLQADPDNSVYVLKVTEAQAEEIAHVQAIGADFTMGLRPPGDDRSFDPASYGQTTNSLIDLFGFKIPSMIVLGSPAPQPSLAPSASPAS